MPKPEKDGEKPDGVRADPASAERTAKPEDAPVDASGDGHPPSRDGGDGTPPGPKKVPSGHETIGRKTGSTDWNGAGAESRNMDGSRDSGAETSASTVSRQIDIPEMDRDGVTDTDVPGETSENDDTYDDPFDRSF